MKLISRKAKSEAYNQAIDYLNMLEFGGDDEGYEGEQVDAYRWLAKHLEKQAQRFAARPQASMGSPRP